MQIDIGKHLKSKRMTQSALAEEVGISRGYLSAIVSGQKEPSLGTLQSIASALGVETGDLFRRASSAPMRNVGFSENDALPFMGPSESAIARAARAMGASLRHPQIYTANVTDAGLAIAKGDVLVIEMNGEATTGSLVVATRLDPNSGDARTIIRRFAAPWLVGGETAPVEMSDDGQIAILGTVRGVLRETLADKPAA